MDCLQKRENVNVSNVNVLTDKKSIFNMLNIFNMFNIFKVTILNFFVETRLKENKGNYAHRCEKDNLL